MQPPGAAAAAQAAASRRKAGTDLSTSTTKRYRPQRARRAPPQERIKMHPYPARSSAVPRGRGQPSEQIPQTIPPAAGKRPRPPKPGRGRQSGGGGRPAAFVGGIGGASPPPAHAARRRHAPDRRARAVGRSPPEAEVDGRREHPRRDGPMPDRVLGSRHGGRAGNRMRWEHELLGMR